MKHIKTTILAVGVALLTSGCSVYQIASGVHNIRSAYQAVEGFSAIKPVEKQPPVFKGYETIFVKFDVQPRKGDAVEYNRVMSEALCRNINDLSAGMEVNVTCRPYVEAEVAQVAEALVLTVKETGTRGLLHKLASGENLHAEAQFVDKSSAKLILNEPITVSTYDALAGYIIMNTQAKLFASGPFKENPTDDDRREWSERYIKLLSDENRKMLTDEEVELLKKP